MRTRYRPYFPDPLGRPLRLTGSADSVSCPTGCRGDSATLRSPGNTPLGSTDGLCRANPLGHPAGAHAGRTFCDPRTSCGRTIGRTIALLNRARVGRILEVYRSTRWLDLFPSAPFLASIPAERIAFRLVRIIAGVQMVVHYDEGICSLSLSEARRLLSTEAHSKAPHPAIWPIDPSAISSHR